MLTIEPFEIRTQDGQQIWRQLLLGIERDLVLAGARRGMIARDLAEYLFARSGGHFASLMSLISRGWYRAVKTGAESLTAGLLNAVRIDPAAEDARSQLQAAIQDGSCTSRLGLARQPSGGRERHDRPASVHAHPLDREPFDVWLHAYAARLHMGAGDLAGALGIPGGGDYRRHPAGPSPGQLAAICTATGLALSAVPSCSLPPGRLPPCHCCARGCRNARPGSAPPAWPKNPARCPPAGHCRCPARPAEVCDHAGRTGFSGQQHVPGSQHIHGHDVFRAARAVVRGRAEMDDGGTTVRRTPDRRGIQQIITVSAGQPFDRQVPWPAPTTYHLECHLSSYLSFAAWRCPRTGRGGPNCTLVKAHEGGPPQRRASRGDQRSRPHDHLVPGRRPDRQEHA